MMKILLIYPYCLEERIQDDDVQVVPIGLYYIGALLKENQYDVEILNWYDINKTPERIEKELIDKKPDIIGFSVLHANRWGAIEISRIAKRLNPEIKIVFGGIGASVLWKHFLTNFPEVDFVIIREGEYPFLALVRRIEAGNYNDLNVVKGLVFRDEGKIVKTEAAEFIENLDELPNPAKYFNFQHLSSTRGCPWACSFCGSPQFWNRTVRFHSPEYFVSSLELLYKKGVRFFYFSDDTFTIDEKRVIKICKQIIERGIMISWFAISRVSYINDEILSWMRRAGCIQISYGVESGSEKVRNTLNKKISTKQIKKAFSLTRKYGILPRAYFIYGSPGESWATIQESVDLILEIKPLSVIFYILDIFPGTALYYDFKERCNVKEDIWLKRIEDIMYFETDSSLDGEMILAFGEKLRKEFYGNLTGFIDSLELIEDKKFYPMHSDFLSRLGMTFSHGDYSKNKYIRGKEKTAENLFNKALTYSPNPRAYLGLGILYQKKASYDKSIEVLNEALEYFPKNEQLITCLGISYMNKGEYQEALGHFSKLPPSRETRYYISQCYEALQ